MQIRTKTYKNRHRQASHDRLRHFIFKFSLSSFKVPPVGLGGRIPPHPSRNVSGQSGTDLSPKLVAVKSNFTAQQKIEFQ